MGAIEAVRRGWAILPLVPGGKEPYSALLPRDRHGEPSWRLLAVTPATEAEVLGWYAKDHAANWGLILGQGIVAVDVDGEHPRHLHLPPTAQVQTGRGSHYLYRTDRPTPTLKCPWGELRGDGSYIVGVGSLHPSGVRYQWSDYCNPEEIGIADLPPDLLQAVEEEHNRQSAHRGQTGQFIHNQYISYRSTEPEVHAPAFDYAVWVTREDVALSIMQACGVASPQLKKPFKCVLPGHEEKKASASLFRVDDGTIAYRDWHQKDGAAWYTLGEVFASVVAGKVLDLGPGEKTVWLIRALIRCGYLKPPAIWAPKLPADVQAGTRDVFNGFRELVACRHLYQGGDPGGTMFSWRFAAAWCGRSHVTVGRAMEWLLKHGYLKRVAVEGGGKRAATMFVLSAPNKG